MGNLRGRIPKKPMYKGIDDLLPRFIGENEYLYKLIAEMLGTAMIVVFGVGSVCSAVVANSMQGLWQVASIWGFGVAFAIYVSAPISGAHLNPAMSLAIAILRPHTFRWRDLLPYWLAQLIGGIIGGFINYRVYFDLIDDFETNTKKIKRGKRVSVYSAMIFGEYFPNPTLDVLKASTEDVELDFDTKLIPPYYAFFVEMWGTAILCFMIFFFVDSRQKVVPPQAAPFFIGFTVAVLIALYGPITQGGFNPARDFGPRLVALGAGWGKIAIPGPRDGFWVYIVGPLIGAPLGGLFYDLLVAPGLNQAKKREEALLLATPEDGAKEKTDVEK